jgi:hypothetical protein
MAPFRNGIRNWKYLAGVFGILVLLSSCKSCDNTSSGGGYDTPLPPLNSLLSRG